MSDPASLYSLLAWVLREAEARSLDPRLLLRDAVPNAAYAPEPLRSLVAAFHCAKLWELQDVVRLGPGRAEPLIAALRRRCLEQGWDGLREEVGGGEEGRPSAKRQCRRG